MLERFFLLLFSSFCFFIAPAQLSVDDFNRAIELNNQGYELLSNGSYNDASRYFMKAIELDSTERKYYLNLNSACNEMKNFKLSRKYFEIAKRIFFEDDEIFYCAGLINKNLGFYKPAVADFTDAIKFSAKYDEPSEQFYAFYFNRGVCYLRLEDYSRASRDFSSTLEINPYHHGAFANRGMARYNLKDKAGACGDWQEASQLGYEEAREYIVKFCR